MVGWSADSKRWLQVWGAGVGVLKAMGAEWVDFGQAYYTSPVGVRVVSVNDTSHSAAPFRRPLSAWAPLEPNP